ncbi:MAG: ThiF family adenylyltransferase [Myxococcota bacterium]
MSFSSAHAFERNVGLIDRDEQATLSRSRVGIAGCGGVGGVHAHTLVRLGIGGYRLADPDRFSLSNFNRQIGATVETLGEPKTHVTARMVRSINPEADVEVFDAAIGRDNVDAFLAGLDLVIDGLDFFALPARRVLYRAAREHGVPVVVAAPLGFSGTLHVFRVESMSFDEYFDLHDGQDPYDQYVNFLLGLAPAGLHATYTDISTADPATGRGPSSIIGTQLAACVAGAEAIRILLGRGPSFEAPRYLQVDVYRHRMCSRRLRGGCRHPLQRLKKLFLKRYLAGHGLDVALQRLDPA